MNCPRCHGKGRLIGQCTIHQGRKQSITLDEIQGLCPDCMGQGTIHCCEGDIEQAAPTRAQAMLNATDEDLPSVS
jgi:RecJ-like exonuclease